MIHRGRFRVEYPPVKDENGELAGEPPKPVYREVSFMRDDTGWVIDWEALVRYSSNSSSSGVTWREQCA